MKKLSVRMRLTLTVALMLTALCLALTLCVQYQMRAVLVEPMQHAIKIYSLTSATEESKPVELLPAQQSVPAMKATLAQGELTFTWRLWLVMGGTVLLGSLLTYAVASIALKPLRKLSAAIDNMDETTLVCNFQDFQAGDEVNRLAVSFDALLARLRTAFERERRFSAYAAHELKTPLAVVKTALDIMDDEDYADPELCRETLQTIGKQNARMIALSSQLLLLSQLQTERSVQSVRADALLAEITEELAPLAAEQDVRVECSLAPCEVTANPLMLKHALSNVVENAIRYNRRGGRVQVRLNSGVLTVADTGIGIPAADAEHIFEAFYRVDKSRSRSAGGTGLGLAITREILTQCGASVRCEPNEPSGSIFTVRFSDFSDKS